MCKSSDPSYIYIRFFFNLSLLTNSLCPEAKFQVSSARGRKVGTVYRERQGKKKTDLNQNRKKSDGHRETEVELKAFV